MSTPSDNKLLVAYRRLATAEELYPPTHTTVWARKLAIQLIRAEIEDQERKH